MADKFAATTSERYEIPQVDEVNLDVGGNFRSVSVTPTGGGSNVNE